MANFITGSLKGKLLITFLAIALLPVAIVGYMAFVSGKATIQRDHKEALTAIVQTRELTIVEYLKAKENIAMAFASDIFIRDSVAKMNQKGQDADALAEKLAKYLEKEKMPVDAEIYDTIIFNPAGKVIVSPKEDIVGKDKSNDDYFLGGKNGVYIKDAYHSETTGKDSIAASTPLKDAATGELIGVIVNRYETKGLERITTDRTGMGSTGEIYIVNKDGYMITESRFLKGTFLRQKVDTEPVRLFQGQKKIMAGIYSDYRGVPVLGSSMGDEIAQEFSNLGWTILAEIDVSEAFAPIKALV